MARFLKDGVRPAGADLSAHPDCFGPLNEKLQGWGNQQTRARLATLKSILGSSATMPSSPALSNRCTSFSNFGRTGRRPSWVGSRAARRRHRRGTAQLHANNRNECLPVFPRDRQVGRNIQGHRLARHCWKQIPRAPGTGLPQGFLGIFCTAMARRKDLKRARPSSADRRGLNHQAEPGPARRTGPGGRTRLLLQRRHLCNSRAYDSISGRPVTAGESHSEISGADLSQIGHLRHRA